MSSTFFFCFGSFLFFLIFFLISSWIFLDSFYRLFFIFSWFFLDFFILSWFFLESFSNIFLNFDFFQYCFHSSTFVISSVSTISSVRSWKSIEPTKRTSPFPFKLDVLPSINVWACKTGQIFDRGAGGGGQTTLPKMNMWDTNLAHTQWEEIGRQNEKLSPSYGRWRFSWGIAGGCCGNGLRGRGRRKEGSLGKKVNNVINAKCGAFYTGKERTGIFQLFLEGRRDQLRLNNDS